MEAGKKARRGFALKRMVKWSAFVLCLAGGAVAQAAPFDGGVVTLVVPASAGSSFDNAARSVAEGLSKKWGVPVVVNNRAGAATIVGSSAVAKAAPDGRTILLFVTPSVQAPFLQANLDYDPITSFKPVAQMFDARLWLGINSDLKADNVKDFMAQAKKAKPHLKYASPGNGSTPHLSGAQLADAGGVDMMHVPFKGMSPAIVALASGVVDSAFASYSDLLPHAQSGKIRILASAGAKRSALTPNIPTMEEAGYPGFDLNGFGGLVVPTGTPQSLVDVLSRDVREILTGPGIKERFTALGFELNYQDSANFGEIVKQQSREWKALMDRLGVNIL